MKFTDPGVLQAIRYGHRDGPVMPLVSGDFELGIDMRRKDWPGDLFIVSGPDPHILIADEVLHQMRWRPKEIHPDVTLTQQSDPCPAAGCCKQSGFLALRGNNCFYGAILRVVTQTQTVIYQIGEYDPERNAWWAAWPD